MNDKRARLEARIQRAEGAMDACYPYHRGWLLRISLPGPKPDPAQVHLFNGMITPCTAYQGQPDRRSAPLVFHPSTTRPTCNICRGWKYRPGGYEGAELLHRGAARLVNQMLSGEGDAAQMAVTLQLLAAPLTLEPLAALLAQADVPRETKE